LTIERGYHRVVENFNLEIRKGSIVHLEGNNGSGKSSILRTVSGLFPLYEGSVKWRGTPIESIDSYCDNVNYLGHFAGLSPELTSIENLIFYKLLSASKKPALEIPEALKTCGADYLSSKYVKHLSAGERQKLAVARLLMFSCPLWLLDEPFNSLDSDTQKILEEKIDGHSLTGGIVLMTSHQSFKTVQPLNSIRLKAK